VLTADSQNEYDCFAIKVRTKKGKDLGYLKKELAQSIVSLSAYRCLVVLPIPEGYKLNPSTRNFGATIVLVNNRM